MATVGFKGLIGVICGRIRLAANVVGKLQDPSLAAENDDISAVSRMDAPDAYRMNVLEKITEMDQFHSSRAALGRRTYKIFLSRNFRQTTCAAAARRDDLSEDQLPEMSS